MTTLELDEAEVTHQGRRVGPLRASWDGSVILLWGDFTWLFAWLGGQAVLEAGAVRCLGVDARSAVIAGTTSVSPALIQPAPSWSVLEWLTLNLELLGRSPRRAKAQAVRTLDELVLTNLSRRRVSDLNPAESFAAHAAFALSNEPQLAVLSAPVLLPETRDYELAVIDRLLSRAKLAIACTRRDETLWGWADAHAYCGGGSRSTLPVDLMAKAASTYRVRSFGPTELLQRTLESRGATVGLAEGGLLVTPPHGSGSELIVAAAVESSAPLSELVSVPEAR